MSKKLRNTTNPPHHQHSTACLEDYSHTNSMDTSGEISLSDLAPIKPSRRRMNKNHRSRSMEEDSSWNMSSRTATTVNSSYNNQSSLLMSDTSLSDSGYSMSSSSRRNREVRNLQGIRRRRSDPVTRRWREQCSKLYKEHVLQSPSLDSCPEQPPPLVTLTAPQPSPETKAALKIQSGIRQFLDKNNKRQSLR